MLTALIIVLSALAVCAAGEMVRTQIRRMLSRPAALPGLAATSSVRSTVSVGTVSVGSEAAAA